MKKEKVSSEDIIKDVLMRVNLINNLLNDLKNDLTYVSKGYYPEIEEFLQTQNELIKKQKDLIDLYQLILGQNDEKPLQ